MAKLSYTVATEEIHDPKILALRGDFEMNVALLSQLGYHGLEMMVRDVNELKPDRINRSIKSHNLEIAAVSTGQIAFEDGLYMSSLNDNVYYDTIGRLKEIVEFTASLDCKLINIGTIRGTLPEDMSQRQEAEKRFFQGMCLIANYAGEKGITIALEPQSRYLVNWQNTIAENLDFIEQIGLPNIQLLYDCYHTMLEEEHILFALIKNIKSIAHIQISDSNRLSPGLGMLPFHDFLRVLRVLDYQGFVSVEVLQKPSGHEAAKLSANFLLPILNEQIFYQL